MKRFLAIAFILCVSVLAGFTTQTKAAVPDTLNYGFSWFDVNNTSTPAFNTDGSYRYVTSNFYDPSKPVVIYFHGWQKDSCAQGYSRENFLYQDPTMNNQTVDLIRSWKGAGWNVAIFYWNQFADEGEVKDAEAKIWSAYGPKAMRYRLSDNSYSSQKSPSISVSDIAFNQYKNLLPNFYGSEVRFAGHSLGNQLATNVAMMISNAVQAGQLNVRTRVARLELLDPFWSKDGKSFLGGQWTGERVRNYIIAMKNLYALRCTWYKTSAILDVMVGDQNLALRSYVAFANPESWFLNSTDWGGKHVWAPRYYFYSFSCNPPVECTINWLKQRSTTGNYGPSASSSSDRIWQMQNSSYYWVQVEGRYSPNPNDDWAERKNK